MGHVRIQTTRSAGLLTATTPRVLLPPGPLDRARKSEHTKGVFRAANIQLPADGHNSKARPRRQGLGDDWSARALHTHTMANPPKTRRYRDVKSDLPVSSVLCTPQRTRRDDAGLKPPSGNLPRRLQGREPRSIRRRNARTTVLALDPPRSSRPASRPSTLPSLLVDKTK